MANSSHTIEKEIHGVVSFVAAIWGVFFASWLFPKIDDFGIVPRTLWGLVGILAAPLLHANVQHLLANTLPLLVLLALLAGSRARSWLAVMAIVLLGGALLWLIGPRNTDIIGASGLIFGLITFLIVSGVLERRIVPLLIAVVVGVTFGGTLIWGILPQSDPRISWQGHLCGALAGAVVAYFLTRKPRKPSEEKKEVRS